MMGSLGFAGVLTERVLNSIPEGLLIAAVAWLLLRLVGRQNSGTRFGVWFFSLLAIVGVPFVPAIPFAGTLRRAVQAEVVLPGSWALAIVSAWSLIALLAMVRLIHGLWRVSSLREQAEPVSLPALDPSLRQTIEQCQAVRFVEIRSSAGIGIPTVVGFFKPVILIPGWTLQELPTEDLQAIVLHEFAHLRRWDDWTNLAQKIVRALFFFHPAVLWIESRISLEREMACDEVVLAETKNPPLYARCLLSLAEKSFLRRSLAVTQAAIGRAHETSVRLARILDLDRPKATTVCWPVLGAVAAFIMLCILALPGAPRLISFQDSAPAVNVAIEDDIQTAPQLPTAMLIPAMAHVDRARPASTKLTKAEQVHAQAMDKPKAVFAKHKGSPKLPFVLRASAKKTTTAPQYLVITQSTDYYREGSAVVSVSVWRVTLLTLRQPVAPVNKAPNQT